MKRILIVLLVICLVFPVISFSAPEYSLAIGSQSDAVVALQYALYLNGFMEEKYVTGYYGKITTQAVMAYQKLQGFTEDGIAGPSTLTALLGNDYLALFDVDAYATKATSNPVTMVASQSITVVPESDEVQVNISSAGVQLSEPLVMGIKSDFIKLAQERLVSLGYLQIVQTTRYFGEMTEAAIKRFQRVNGLVADGVIGNATASKLMSNDALPSSADGNVNLSLPTPVVNISSVQYPVAASSNVVQVAMEQLGKPYRYAARGMDAFDCSGLVYYAFKVCGIKLPTSSSAQSQYENAIRIRKSELQIGDVVFFNTGNSSVSINHCGIYIGNGQFIHASSGGGKVQINSLSTDFYSGAFRWALRILN